MSQVFVSDHQTSERTKSSQNIFGNLRTVELVRFCCLASGGREEIVPW